MTNEIPKELILTRQFMAVAEGTSATPDQYVDMLRMEAKHLHESAMLRPLTWEQALENAADQMLFWFEDGRLHQLGETDRTGLRWETLLKAVATSRASSLWARLVGVQSTQKSPYINRQRLLGTKKPRKPK